MFIAATLSLAFALLARRFDFGAKPIRLLSRDPRWVAAAMLAAVLLAIAISVLLRRAG
ncbi:hypothetical protein [Kaistia algarum]|uniref:hypothetical protein n=1 Tax=Kaistia algarum TaxID=2083279 RepID=UPI00140224EC|nr:hypothetical protein [Kaistia algarum]MCX5513396.1 hypothetical protein [Kaistia algarum]